MLAEKTQSVTLQNKPCLLSLQSLRAIAFSGVFISHCDILDLGKWGVSIFFVLSGFVMVYNYYDRDIKCSLKNSLLFALKRIAKLYPLHILTLIATLFLTEELSMVFQNPSVFKKVILNILLIQSWFPQASVYWSLNGVAWYLSVCLFIYTLFPLIITLIKKYNKPLTALFSILIIFSIQFVLSFLTQYVHVSTNFCQWATYIFPLFRLGDFAIGCHLGYLFLQKRYSIKTFTATLSECLVVVLIIFSQFIFNGHITFSGTAWYRYTVLYLPSTIPLIYLFALNQGVISKILTNKVLIFIGNISAYAFLIHQVCIRYIDKFSPTYGYIAENIWVRFFVAFAATILLSVLYRQTEHYIKRKLKKLLNVSSMKII